jgi:hypothetical protein
MSITLAFLCSGFKRRRAKAALGLVLAVCGGSGCAEEREPSGPAGSRVTLELRGLRPLDAHEGRYRARVRDAEGRAHDAGILELAPSGTGEFANPIDNGVALEISLEPPAGGSAVEGALLLRGSFRGGTAALSLQGAVTRGDLPLRERPGQFTMFTPSNNFRDGYPSHEESGVWLFNVFPRETDQNDTWVRLTPLAPGWVYEGWMVRDIDTPAAVWLSYGKFLTDVSGAVNSRDDTGWGAFSGVSDFRTAGDEEFPGDDWVANPLGFAWPAELPLPLNLREKTAGGAYRWTHVITIEPAWDRGEAILSERPFLIQPYRDAFGDGAPGTPRTITLHGDGVPQGVARVR